MAKNSKENGKLKIIPIKKLKKMEKEDRLEYIASKLPDIVQYYSRNFLFRPREDRDDKRDVKNKIFELLTNEKYFVKPLTKLLKKSEEPSDFKDIVPVGILIIINDLIKEYDGKNVDFDFEYVSENYQKIAKFLTKDRVKKISKKTGLSKDIVMQLLYACPDPSLVNRNNTWLYMDRITKKLYAITANLQMTPDEYKKEFANKKMLRKVFEYLLGDKKEVKLKMLEVMMLEKTYTKNKLSEMQLILWDVITELCLEELECQGKDDIKVCIKAYLNRRSKEKEKDRENRDAARRIELNEIERKDYPKIYKIYDNI